MSNIYLYKRLLIIVLGGLLGQISVAQGPLAVNLGEDPLIQFSAKEIQAQLNALPDPLVTPYYNSVVASYIKTYTVKSRPRTERMLGRMELYFPIFEKYLHEAGMPSSLKYVAVLESALDPMATSRSGAAGLWQIMPITAKDLKLRVSRYVDDRRDPERSTKAAVAYLKKLYNRFGSWELALAAYNGGPGRVSRAIRRTGINDFWQLQKHLPRETRNYVSAYIGANYIANYYYQYNLNPAPLNHKLRNTTTLEINQLLRFSEVAEISGIDKALIQELNPRYPRGYVPEKSSGYPIQLPFLEAALIKNRLGLENDKNKIPVAHRQLSYEVQPTDNFAQLCKDLKCLPEAVIGWNGLLDLQLNAGQVLTYYKPLPAKPKRKKYTIPTEIQAKINFEKFPTAPLNTNIDQLIRADNFTIASPAMLKTSPIRKQGKRKIYVVQAGESLRDIAQKLGTLSLAELMNINHLRPSSRILPGQHLLIK